MSASFFEICVRGEREREDLLLLADQSELKQRRREFMI